MTDVLNLKESSVVTLRAPDPKYAVPLPTDKYQPILSEACSKEHPANHGRWWVLDEWDGDDNKVAIGLRRKLVEKYGTSGFGFKVVVATDRSSVALLVRFDPPNHKEVPDDTVGA